MLCFRNGFLGVLYINFKSSYGNIYYEIHGQDNSTVVAFLHGILMNHKMFEKQIDAFRDEYKLLLWDMPEHGQSVKLQRDFDFSVVADCFIELLDELKIQEVILVGVSLGGWVSQFIAQRHPDRVKALALEGSTPLHVDLRKMAFIFKVYCIMFRLLPWKLVKRIMVKMTEKMELDPDLKEVFKEIFFRLEKKTVLHLFRGVSQEIRKGIEEDITHPILMTHGEKELGFFKKMGRTWEEKNPRLEYREIPGAGHGANTFNPEEYNRDLERFLSFQSGN